jgi:xanthine dehydrogenase accessory factor
VVGKMPMEVAISVAGQIIESYQALLPTHGLSDEQRQSKNKGIAWKEIKQLFNEQPQLSAQVSDDQTKNII